MAEPDAALVERAPRAVAGLPGLDACADAEGLARTRPLPEDPELRASIEHAQARLDRVDALALAARYQDAHALVLELTELTETLGHDPLHAAALVELGDLQDRRGDPRTAEPTLRRALAIAEAAGDDAVAASAFASLVYVVGLELARADEGRQHAELAAAKSTRLGDPAELRREILANRAMLEYGAGDTEAARAWAQEAIELVETHWGPDALQLQSLLDLLGSIHRVRGERAPAEAAFRRALDLVHRRLGPEHPAAAPSHGNLATVLYSDSRHEEALEHAERALSLFQSVDERTPFVASALNNVANIHTALDDHAEALAMHERALAVRVAIFGERHPDVAQSLDGMGSALVALGRAEEGLARHREALAMHLELLGDEHPALAYDHQGIGRALLELGRPQEALAPLEAALVLRSEPHDVDPVERGETELVLAEALATAGGDRERARALLLRATEDLSDAPDHAKALRRVQRLLGERPTP